MHSFSDIARILLESVFTGFGITIILFSLVRTSNLKTLEFVDAFRLTAIQIARLAGILCLILVATEAYEMYFSNSYIHVNIPGDEYLLRTYFPPAITFFITQLFWIKKLYMRKAALITLSLLLLILPSRFFMTYVVLDGATKAGTPDLQWFFVEKALNVVIFFFITFAVMSFGNLRKKNKPA